jgi:branched chain amino acid efflux pump
VISLHADRRDVAAGARAMAPWLAGVVPFGLVIGVSAAQADDPTLAGWLTGPLSYAGSAQVEIIIVAAGLGSYLFRLSMIILTGRTVIAVLRAGSPQAAILVGMPVLWITTALLLS